jgi:hypothetical protein
VGGDNNPTPPNVNNTDNLVIICFPRVQRGDGVADEGYKD